MFLRKLTLSGLWCLYRSEELIFNTLMARKMSSKIGTASRKPPNILIQEDDNQQKAQRLIERFERALEGQYVVYGISSSLLSNSKSWMDNIQLLVVHQNTSHLTNVLRDYLAVGGKLLNMSPDNEEDSYTNTIYQSYIRCSGDIEEETLKNILRDKFGLKITTDIQYLERSYSCGYLVTGENKLSEFIRSRASSDSSDTGSIIRQSEITLDFGPPHTQSEPSGSYIPVRPPTECTPSFDSSLYLSHLVTKELGRTLVYVPCMSSSMAVFQVKFVTFKTDSHLFLLIVQGRPLMEGLTVVPGRQMAGVGRGGNKWLSPPGCSMFSSQLSLGANTWIGRRASLIQHLVALAHVEAVRSEPGYEEVDLRIKWPNDIYYGSKNKIGGVILKSSVFRDKIIVTVGAGINLNNQHPTVSMNQILRENGHEVLDQEVLLARTLNSLEKILEKCSQGQFSEVESLYYRYWLHGGHQIRVRDKDSEQSVTVLGIDQFGFLRVRGSDDSVFSVMDDGNSFDMMQGLVKPKER